jgi:phosphate transport system substrate-binding protein
MVNVAQAWAEHYANVDPAISVEVAGGGSATGIAALIEGAADLANCSRKMDPSEIALARKRTGREPKQWIVGLDALAIYVHPSNPLESITLEQLAQMYGRNGKATHWSDMGIRLARGGDEIILISRQSNSGTFQYFKQAILGRKGDFRMGTRDLNGSKEVVSLTASTPGAIGYSGMGYATPDVKMLPVAKTAKDTPQPPTPASALSGKYPIARPLYIYTLGEPTGAVKEYMDWILSPDGQMVVEKAGYVAVAPTRRQP